jgi:hypothetical protein
MLRFPRRALALRSRLRARSGGFSHISQTIEAAAVMAWFVILVVGEKYVGDSTSARRSTENAVQQSSVASAIRHCQGGGEGLSFPGPVQVSSGVGVHVNGMPQVTMNEIPSIISGLGVTSLRTLPVYFKPFQTTSARATAAEVTAGAPLSFRSGEFEGVREMACLEPSLDSPGAPWVSIESSRTMIFVKNVLGYR